MADMRDALRKAGLVSEKQARQARHKKRLHRKEVGDEGLAEEKRRKEEEFRKEQEAKRERDRRIEAERAAAAEAARAAASADLAALVRNGLIGGAVGGPKQYFFTLPDGRITCLELSDSGFKRMIGGSGAIVESFGAARGPYCVVDPSTASAIQKEKPEAVLDWPRRD